MESEHEQRGLLRMTTFTGVRSAPAAPPTREEIIKRVFGTPAAPPPRNTESLDYEPVQNKIFYARMKAAKDQRNLFGCVKMGQQDTDWIPVTMHCRRNALVCLDSCLLHARAHEVDAVLPADTLATRSPSSW